MKLRDVIGQINFMEGRRSVMNDARRLVLGTAAQARKGQLGDQLRGMMEIEEKVNRETSSWLEPEEITDDGGVFDSCDLRVWLKMAEEAGVDYIPAKTILSVSEEDLSGLLGTIGMPENLTNNARKHLAKTVENDAELSEIRDNLPDPEPGPSHEHLVSVDAAMSDAMESIPPSWMVRTHLCGASNLKALVGTGLMLKGDDVAEIAPDVKLGAGWVQVGNRRTIDFKDTRFVEMGARGHKPVTHYLARPWEEPGRFHEGEDIHRAGSPLAGPGKWPAEWRVFVKNGEVTGTANYYGWTGEGATPENAWNAIEAAGQAQKLIDHMVGLRLRGETMDTVLLRSRKNDPQVEKAFESWDPTGLHATLDFIEGADGLKLLEGGPPHMIGAGGHPCAFAGQNVDPKDPARLVAACEGVAFLPMAHVSLGEPKTWVDGDPEDRIATFEQAVSLALDHAALSDDANAFLSRIGLVQDDDTPEP
ncbi:MAG: hypothetical protein ABJN42_29785 [Roseibium sp.]|uniref:hypothetical protein n=1 Tax=Roseibium sp. TaxID=1936156 RepID=UPI003297E32A